MSRDASGNAAIHQGDGVATLGILEWFTVNEHERVERVLHDMARCGMTHLRTGVSWADWHTDAGRAWYEWLLPRLSRDVQILPCVLYTPPSMGIVANTSSPPQDIKAYADFIDVLITQFGRHVEWIELWNEPNNLSEWDWTLDPGWSIFAKMIIGAGYWARHRGKKVLLGGASPIDPHWFGIMCRLGVMEHVDAVGIHGFPGTWEATWLGWSVQVDRVQKALAAHGCPRPIWITETGYSTWRHDELRQVEEYMRAMQAPVERVYWYSMDDLHPERATVDGFHSDEREYHFGLKCADGTEKLLFRLLSSGASEDAPRDLTELAGTEDRANGSADTLIIGGAGEIGSTIAQRLLAKGRPVRLMDNLSKPGSVETIGRLKAQFGNDVQINIADLRNRAAVRRAINGVNRVVHCGDVSSESSTPVTDFEVRARGTLLLLEELRLHSGSPELLYISVLTHESDMFDHRDCTSVYAENIVRCYARTHGLNTVVVRRDSISSDDLIAALLQPRVNDQFTSGRVFAPDRMKPLTASNR